MWHAAAPPIPQFQLCGTCLISDTISNLYDIKATDPQKDAAQREHQYYGHPEACGGYIDSKWHVKVYTDGSCFNGTNRALARAGWGVFFAKGSSNNCSHPLDGPLQSSYRAEARA